MRIRKTSRIWGKKKHQWYEEKKKEKRKLLFPSSWLPHPAMIALILIIIIIITRPKPAYGRQGLAGFWGQDTDQAGSFWGVLNVSLRAYGAQLGFKPTRKMKNHKKQPGITKHLHGTMNNHNNYLEPKITIKFHL